MLLRRGPRRRIQLLREPRSNLVPLVQLADKIPGRPTHNARALVAEVLDLVLGDLDVVLDPVIADLAVGLHALLALEVPERHRFVAALAEVDHPVLDARMDVLVGPMHAQQFPVNLVLSWRAVLGASFLEIFRHTVGDRADRPTSEGVRRQHALPGLVPVIPGVGLRLTGEEAIDLLDKPVVLYIPVKQLLDSRTHDQEAVLVPKVGDAEFES